MRQGDAYPIAITIEIAEGTANESTFEDVEVTMGNIIKTLSKKEITYDKEQKAFLFPLTQQETFNLPANTYQVQVRVKVNDTWVQGGVAGQVKIESSISRQVL